MIVSSAISEGVPQVDGRFEIIETHTNDDGRVFQYKWLSDGTLNSQFVMEERALVINATLAAREAARIAVVGTDVPYTKHEFLSRFTQAERKAIRAFAAGSHPYAPDVEDYMEMLSASGGVYMTLARPGLAALRDLGLLTAERASIIGVD